MTDVRRLLEERRLGTGLTQGAVADALGITQPHYSKVVGGVVPLTGALAARMSAWIGQAAPARRSRADPGGADGKRIRQLVRSISRDLRELDALLGPDGKGRLPGRKRLRGATPPDDPA